MVTETKPPGVLDQADFDRLVRPLVGELRLHCYRMVGRLDEADDLAQETLERAWRRRHQLENPSALRAWVYRIATNACLDRIDKERRRVRRESDMESVRPDPYPDTWLDDLAGTTDPSNHVVGRETVALAFLAVVQLLPPRQRAILVLREVLGWPAPEVAEALGTTTAAVNSGLQRARATIRLRLPAGWRESASAAAEEGAMDVARRYLDAWERADADDLAALLTADARMAMPPDPLVFRGREAIQTFSAEMMFNRPAGRRLRLVLTAANLQPAFVVWEPDPITGIGKRIGLKILTVRDGQVAEIYGYMRPELAARFGDSA